MALINGKGTSDCTPTKLRHFECAIQMHATLSAGILRRKQRYNPRYVYLDLNAGDGQNLINGRDMAGSPIIAARAIESTGMDNLGICFERNSMSVTLLRDRLKKHPAFTVEEGDHSETIDAVMQKFQAEPSQAPRLGVVYCDPNGVLPIDVLSKIFRDPTFATVDCMAYVGATSYKRAHGFRPEEDKHLLLNALNSVPKRYLHIRVPEDKWQWTMVFMTNWEGFPQLTNRGFHRIDTPHGQEIAERLFKTNEQLAGQARPQWMKEIQETFKQGRFHAATPATIAIQQTLEI